MPPTRHDCQCRLPRYLDVDATRRPSPDPHATHQATGGRADVLALPPLPTEARAPQQTRAALVPRPQGFSQGGRAGSRPEAHLRQRRRHHGFGFLA